MKSNDGDGFHNSKIKYTPQAMMKSLNEVVNVPIMKIAKASNTTIFEKEVVDVVESIRTFVQLMVRHYVDDAELGLLVKLPPCTLIYVAVPMSTGQLVAYNTKCKEANQPVVKINKNKNMNHQPTIVSTTTLTFYTSVIITDAHMYIKAVLLGNKYMKDILSTCKNLPILTYA